MSGSNSPKAEQEGSSLLKDLRRFRFQKRLPFNKMSTSDEDSNNSSISDVLTRRKFVNRIEDSDSDTATSLKPQTSGSESEKSEIKEKEEKLCRLKKLFPVLDSSYLLQVLNDESWDLEQAKKAVTKKMQSKKRKKSPKKDSKKKRKKNKMDYGEDNDIDSDEITYKQKLFDSDDDSDVEVSDDLTGDKKAVFEFMQSAQAHELLQLQQCSKKRVDALLECRPFKSWTDLVSKFQNIKYLDMELLNAAQNLLSTRKVVNNVMKKCLRISQTMEKAVEAGASKITVQPMTMTQELKLTPYQMLGLNWLAVMHAHDVNGILADEMGLGKTVQVIAFLTYLKETGLIAEDAGPHVIVVPSSTMDNWMNELEQWSPGLKVVMYYGSQIERKEMRMYWRQGGLDDVDIILTTYNLIISTPEERKLFRVMPIEYVVFDEAHMLKNMSTMRYEHLLKIHAKHRILLTGTPLQNNLVELMSLLVFVMPSMFDSIKKELKSLFHNTSKMILDKNGDNRKPRFEQEQVMNAKQIMKPFVLRRLKIDVLKDLPKKEVFVLHCPMEQLQKKLYDGLIAEYSADVKDAGEVNSTGLMMQLRKIANHPLLVRNYYTEDKLQVIASRLATDLTFKYNNPDHVFQDLLWKSDYQINQLTRTHKTISGFGLPQDLIPISGKFQQLDKMLPELKKDDHRVLIFSQFTMVLDIMEEYMAIRQHKFLRLDGQTPVTERQDMIDDFNEDSSIFIFLLSTKAGGLGINLTAADTVIIHDIDFNPYNDRQAEDRCHRVGQTRAVKVTRLLSKDTIEEQMYEIGLEKLSLEQKVTGDEENETGDKKGVLKLLKMALGLDVNKSLNVSTEKKGSELNGFGNTEEKSPGNEQR